MTYYAGVPTQFTKVEVYQDLEDTGHRARLTIFPLNPSRTMSITLTDEEVLEVIEALAYFVGKDDVISFLTRK